MGYFHEGHLSLMRRAREDNDVVVVSLFVNPIQFNQASDYDTYPRTLAEDAALCERLGADAVFAPEIAEMYPEPQRTFVDVERVSDGLCGLFRPGHFRGVATVVAKLFNAVQPDVAYFGEKDAQQLAVIRKMVKDLNMPVRIEGVATVRESDGLAMSSRNRRLSPEERRVAPALYRALLKAAEAVAAGAPPRAARGAALEVMAKTPEFRVEYLEIVDPEEFQPVELIAGPVRIAAAAWLGGTRLIDNVAVSPIVP
jgi:pantoate--beta-alanine ligase